MFKQVIESIFRFNQITRTAWGIIDLCAVSAVLVMLVLFLFRYFFHYGLLRTFGLSLIIGGIWFVIASAIMTIFYDNVYAGAAVIILTAGIWFLCMLLTVIIRRDLRGPFACLVITCFVILLGIGLCFLGLSNVGAFENFGRTIFKR